MTSGEVPAAPVLVYDRIARNRRKTWMLVAFALAALAPFVLGIAYAAAAGIADRVAPDARTTRAWIVREEALLGQARRGEAAGWQGQLENEVARRRAALPALDAENRRMRILLTPVGAAALLAALGILFWGIAASPTSKLLAQAGAQPAGAAEGEALRLLENLAIGAGLPAPKLYVIESSAPNAFAAGPDPAGAVIAVTRGALDLLDRRELEGVLAHELSHIGHHDIRLNTIVASIALFLRIPYLMFRREAAAEWNGSGTRGTGIWWLAISPVGLYIFFVAPLMAALIRAAVSREREFLADADAALLTGYPEGLLRALAKIGGAGAALRGSNPAFAHCYFANPLEAGSAWFGGRMFATHPPLAERIERLAEFQGAAGLAGVEEAVQAGRQFKRERPAVGFDSSLASGAADELAALNEGNLAGRVCRVAGHAPVPVFETPSAHANRIATVQPGALIVAFDDPGRMRQINTAEQTFGYIEWSVKLTPVERLIPAEIYDPRTRAAAEVSLPPPSAAPARAATGALTARQVAIALGFGVAVFAGMMILLVKAGGR